MAHNGDDVFTRLSVVIEDWSAQIARSHEELSMQIGVARNHLDNLLQPVLQAPQASTVEADEERARLEGEVAQLHEALQAAAAGRDDAAAAYERAIAQLEQELAQARQASAEQAAETKDLTRQLEDARAEMDTLKELVPPPGDGPEVGLGDEERANLEAEISRLSEALAAAESTAGAGEDTSTAPEESDEAALLKAALESLQLEHAEAQDQIRELKQRLDTHRVGPGGIDAFDARGHKKRMGDILVEMGVLTEVQLKSILKEQSADPQRRLGSLVVEHGYTSEELVSRVLAAQLRLPYEDLRDIEPETAATGKVSAHVVRLHRCMPLQEDGGVLTVAMVNPLDLIAIEDLELAGDCRVAPVVSTRDQIEALIEKHYPEAG